MKPEDLKRWRREHGYSQQALAETLGVSKNAIYRWERSQGKGAREIPPYMHLLLECIANKKGGQGPKRKSELSDEQENNNFNEKEVK